MEERDEDGFLPSSPADSEPQTPRTPRYPSEAKTIHCPYEGCQKSFNRNARLQEHLRSHTGERPFNCEQCPKDFLRESHLKHHVKSAHTDERDYKCTWDNCDKSFATGTRLRRHQDAHKVKENYTCRGYEGCSMTFRKHDTLKRHIRVSHEGGVAFQCQHLAYGTDRKCGAAFETAEKLRNHERSKHDRSRFACTICKDEGAINTAVSQQSISFPTYAALQDHMTRVHPPVCTICDHSCKTSKELTRHLELAHGILPVIEGVEEKPKKIFQCSYDGCGKQFSKSGNLLVHTRTVHEGRRDFVCGQTEVKLPDLSTIDLESLDLDGCGRDFTSKSSLEEHIRTTHLNMGSRRAERQKAKKRRRGSFLDLDEVQPKPKNSCNVKSKLTNSATSSKLVDDSDIPEFSHTEGQDALESEIDHFSFDMTQRILHSEKEVDGFADSTDGLFLPQHPDCLEEQLYTALVDPQLLSI